MGAMIDLFPLFYKEEHKPISAKDLEIVIIKPQLASALNAKWHSTLPAIPWSNITRNRFYICFGALFAWRYYAVGIWSSPVNQHFDMNSTLELRRLAISSEAPKFMATRMISQMTKAIKKRFPTICKLISYQDTSAHKGTIYKAANWTAVHTTKFQPWDKSRNRNKPQSRANKIRWEYDIKT